MTVTWDSRTSLCPFRKKPTKRKFTTSWKPLKLRGTSAGLNGRRFCLSCACEGWNAMLPADMRKLSTAASWCFEKNSAGRVGAKLIFQEKPKRSRQMNIYVDSKMTE